MAKSDGTDKPTVAMPVNTAVPSQAPAPGGAPLAVAPPRPTVYHTVGLPSEVEPDEPPETDPKPVVLQRPPKSELNAPLQPPRAAATGPLPRSIHQNERAPDGCRRFRVKCHNYSPHPVRYVLVRHPDDADKSRALAKAEQEARQHYLKVTGLASMIGKARNYDPGLPEADIRMVALPD